MNMNSCLWYHHQQKVIAASNNRGVALLQRHEPGRALVEFRNGVEAAQQCLTAASAREMHYSPSNMLLLFQIHPMEVVFPSSFPPESPLVASLNHQVFGISTTICEEPPPLPEPRFPQTTQVQHHPQPSPKDEDASAPQMKMVLAAIIHNLGVTYQVLAVMLNDNHERRQALLTKALKFYEMVPRLVLLVPPSSAAFSQFQGDDGGGGVRLSLAAAAWNNALHVRQHLTLLHHFHLSRLNSSAPYYFGSMNNNELELSLLWWRLQHQSSIHSDQPSPSSPKDEDEQDCEWTVAPAA